MEAWLIYSEDSAIKNKGYIEFYQREGKKLNIHIKLIYVESMDFGVKDSQLYLLYENKKIGEELIWPDFIINRTIYPLLSLHLERMGFKVFNNSSVSEICNDKARTYQYVARLGIDIVDTVFGKYEHFDTKIEKQYKNQNTDTVVKAVSGHGGDQVFLLEDAKFYRTILEESNLEKSYNNISNLDKVKAIKTGLNHDDYVLQPLTGTRHQDLRVYVIGKKIIASVLRTAKSGFKSNFSLGGDVRLYELNEKERCIVKKIIDAFEFGLVGIDFIIGDHGELIFNEIEDVVGSRMLYQCSDINIVPLYLKYIIMKCRE